MIIARSVHCFVADYYNPIEKVHIYGPKNNEFFMMTVDEIKIQNVYNISQITTEVCLINPYYSLIEFVFITSKHNLGIQLFK